MENYQVYVYALLVLGGLSVAITVLLLLANRIFCNYGPCTIQVNEEDPFTVEGGGTLLDALYANEIFIPSACGGQGTCGFCKCRVLDGGGPLLPTEEPFLSPAELTNQTRLSCQVKVKEDMQVRVREEFLHVQEFQARVTRREMKTPDTVEIAFELIEPAEMEYRPGQYVQIAIPGKKEETWRAYSICTPPSSTNEIELLVRLIPGGLGSTYVHSLEVGDAVKLLGPYGDFYLDDEADLVCVGGGVGMAPMRSLFRHLAEVQPEKRCWLFFGARTTDEAIYYDDFVTLAEQMPNFEVYYAMSEPEKCPDWDGETGFIHLTAEKHLPDAGNRQAFLCGPPPMIEATTAVLTEKNIPKEKVFYDEF